MKIKFPPKILRWIKGIGEDLSWPLQIFRPLPRTLRKIEKMMGRLEKKNPEKALHLKIHFKRMVISGLTCAACSFMFFLMGLDHPAFMMNMLFILLLLFIALQCAKGL